MLKILMYLPWFMAEKTHASLLAKALVAANVGLDVLAEIAKKEECPKDRSSAAKALIDMYLKLKSSSDFEKLKDLEEIVKSSRTN
jgi:hypothetical protein